MDYFCVVFVSEDGSVIRVDGPFSSMGRVFDYMDTSPYRYEEPPLSYKGISRTWFMVDGHKCTYNSRSINKVE